MRYSNDLDGRGQLSEEALAAFTQFFLQTFLDQVSFMASLVQPEKLRGRILYWAAQQIRDGVLPQKAELLLDASERQARRVVAAITEQNVLTTTSTGAPLRLAFPTTLAGQ